MSTTRRAYDMLRAFVNQERSAFGQSGSSQTGDASNELENALNNPWTIEKGNSNDKSSGSLGATPLPAADPKGRARIILGVTENDDFAFVHRRYENLMKRADPANFPNGSQDQFQADRIRNLVADAYRVLTDLVDDTERRFGSLEID